MKVTKIGRRRGLFLHRLEDRAGVFVDLLALGSSARDRLRKALLDGDGGRQQER
jgi:hypothetical protein